MANLHLSLVFRMEMHCAAKAVLIHLAVGAKALFHPSTVAEGLETVFPNIKKIILVDVALLEAEADVVEDWLVLVAKVYVLDFNHIAVFCVRVLV